MPQYALIKTSLAIFWGFIKYVLSSVYTGLGNNHGKALQLPDYKHWYNHALDVLLNITDNTYNTVIVQYMKRMAFEWQMDISTISTSSLFSYIFCA